MAELGPTWERETLGAGHYRHTQHLRRIAYRDGIMRRINNDWQDGDEQRPHMVTAAPFLISVGNDGMRRIHPTREMDRYLEMGAPFIKIGGVWQQVSLGQPTRTGNRLKWTTNNANLYVDMAGHYIKLAILLKNGWRPPDGQFAFPVDLTGLTRQGGQLYADGQPVMTIQAPHVEDYDNPEDVRSVAWDFVQVDGQWYVLFTLPNLAGMSRPLVDPTLELQPDATDGKDTHIHAGSPTNNYGKEAAIFTQLAAVKGLIQFDLTALPVSATVSAASLVVYNEHEAARVDVTCETHRALTEWFEGNQNGAPPPGGVDGSTWNLRNANGAVPWAGGAGGGSGTDYAAAATDSAVLGAVGTTTTWNVLADIIAWLAGANNYGWWCINTTDAGVFKGFSSSDHATAAWRPKLVIDYTVRARKRLLHIPGTDIDPQHFHRFGRI